MSHRNARTTYQGRLLIVERFRDGWNKAHISAAMGISRQCVHKVDHPLRYGGHRWVQDRSSRPRTMHTAPLRYSRKDRGATPVRRAGPDLIGAELGVPARTVSRVLARRGVPHLRDCDPMTGALIRASKHSAVRYERGRPGELVHMDVKKLGRIPDGGGWRAHGRGCAPDRERKRGNGLDFVHSLVDDHSRLAYSEILPDEKGATCAGFLRRAADYFRTHGIAHIERLMTDNAWAYRYSLREVCADLGARQVFIKPHCPWQNGKVERLNRTLKTEWAYRQVFANNADRAEALAPWVEHYNTRRRHSALGGHPPVSRLLPT